METGSFEWAIEMLKQGNWVRADYWSQWGLHLVLGQTPLARLGGKRGIYIETIDGERLLWRSRPYDETDAVWELVTHSRKCELMEMPHAEVFWIKTGQPRV